MITKRLLSKSWKLTISNKLNYTKKFSKIVPSIKFQKIAFSFSRFNPQTRNNNEKVKKLINTFKEKHSNLSEGMIKTMITDKGK